MCYNKAYGHIHGRQISATEAITWSPPPPCIPNSSPHECVCVYVLHVCAYVFAYMCLARGRRGNEVSFCINLHLNFWQNFSPNIELSDLARLLPSKLLESSPLPSPLCCRHAQLHLAFTWMLGFKLSSYPQIILPATSILNARKNRKRRKINYTLSKISW